MGLKDQLKAKEQTMVKSEDTPEYHVENKQEAPLHQTQAPLIQNEQELLMRLRAVEGYLSTVLQEVIQKEMTFQQEIENLVQISKRHRRSDAFDYEEFNRKLEQSKQGTRKAYQQNKRTTSGIDRNLLEPTHQEPASPSRAAEEHTDACAGDSRAYRAARGAAASGAAAARSRLRVK